LNECSLGQRQDNLLPKTPDRKQGRPARIAARRGAACPGRIPPRDEGGIRARFMLKTSSHALHNVCPSFPAGDFLQTAAGEG